MTKEARLMQRLTQTFSPEFIAVDNESHLHASGKGSESHFKITLVSDLFTDKSLVARHRLVRQAVDEEMTGVHALGLHIYTTDEWRAKGYAAPVSPPCAGVGR